MIGTHPLVTRYLGCIALLLLLLLPCCAMPQAAYHITADTSSLRGLSGNLDFQFNPGGSDSLAAQVLIRNVFSLDGTPEAGVEYTGAAAGNIFSASGATIANTEFYNDIFQSYTYGSKLSFDVTFSGPALTPTTPNPQSGTSFAFSLYDAQSPPNALLTSDPGGAVLTVDIAPDGSITYQTFTTDQGDPSIITVAPIPETSSIGILSILLCVFAAIACNSRLRTPKQS